MQRSEEDAVSDESMKNFLETISKWQEANDARCEELRKAHNTLSDRHRNHIDEYNRHIFKHGEESERLHHVAHVVTENAHSQRQQHWLIVGAIAIAAFALGRQS